MVKRLKVGHGSDNLDLPHLKIQDGQLKKLKMNLGSQLELHSKVKLLCPDPRELSKDETETLETIKPFTTRDKNMIVLSNYPEIVTHGTFPVIYFLDHNSYLNHIHKAILKKICLFPIIFTMVIKLIKSNKMKQN